MIQAVFMAAMAAASIVLSHPRPVGMGAAACRSFEAFHRFVRSVCSADCIDFATASLSGSEPPSQAASVVPSAQAMPKLHTEMRRVVTFNRMECFSFVMFPVLLRGRRRAHRGAGDRCRSTPG